MVQDKEIIMLKVAIVTGSTRPGRNGEAVARWVLDIAKKRSDAAFELVDIRDYNLVKNNYGNTAPITPVPESASAWLGILSAAFVVWFYRIQNRIPREDGRASNKTASPPSSHSSPAMANV